MTFDQASQPPEPSSKLTSQLAVNVSIRRYRRLTALCLLFLLAGAIVGIIVPAGPRWDFANFYDTGRRVAAGQISDVYNPDSLIAGEQPQGSWASTAPRSPRCSTLRSEALGGQGEHVERRKTWTLPSPAQWPPAARRV